MTENDGRGARRQAPAGGPPTARRFGGDAPRWPSLHEPAPTPAASSAGTSDDPAASGARGTGALPSAWAGAQATPPVVQPTAPTPAPASVGRASAWGAPQDAPAPTASAPFAAAAATSAPTAAPAEPAATPAMPAPGAPAPGAPAAATPAPTASGWAPSAAFTAASAAATSAWSSTPAAESSTPLTPVLPAAEVPAPATAGAPRPERPTTGAVPTVLGAPTHGSHAAPGAPDTGTIRRLDADGRRPITGAHAAVPPAAAGAATTSASPVAAATAGAPIPPAPASRSAAAAAPDGDDAPVDPPRRSRRWLWIALVGVVVLAAAGVTGWYLTRDDGGTAAAPPDVVLPSPTSTVAPAARTATTPFATALPTTVLQYALATSADDPEWLALNALEAYTETYTDGSSGTVTVQAGQWESADQAAAALATLSAALPTASADPAAATDPTSTVAAGGPSVLEQGEVVVGGTPTGTMTVVDMGDGTGVALWSNGTTVFRLVGPAAEIANLYAAYPL